VKMPKRYSDIAPSWRVQIALNSYREAAARARDLVEHLEDMVAEQEQRDRDARRATRKGLNK